MNTTVYVIIGASGHYFRSYKQGRRDYWFVPALNQAMFYAKEGTAKSVATQMMNKGQIDNLTVKAVDLVLRPEVTG